MVIKTICMLLMLLVPFGFIIGGSIQSTALLFTLYGIAGLGMAGIGMGVMHDAVHGAYSLNPKINKLLGYSMNLIGSNDRLWHIKHNVLHHTYTNVEEHDGDIEGTFFLRFSPNSKYYSVTRFQFIYAWFFYGLATLDWVAIKDFIMVFKFQRNGLLKGKFLNTFTWVMLWKVFFFTYSIILPIYFVPQGWGVVVLAFVFMHFVTGFLLTVVFQLAHVLPSTEYPLPDKTGVMENDWAVHQFITTSNFAPKSKIMAWFIGGLNYQVEHHLFPDICHVHYPKISAIVENTAKEFGVPYLTKPTFVSALWSHTKMLYRLGMRTS